MLNRKLTKAIIDHTNLRENKRVKLIAMKKPGLKQANTSMSVPPLASYKWAIKHKRNRKTTKNQAQSNPYCPILGPCPTLGTIASGNFL